MIMMSQHFSERELRCPCCQICEVDARLLKGLESYRELTGQPCHVTSACRCEAHNLSVGGSRESKHIAFTHNGCMAADIHTDGLTVAQMIALAEQVPEFAAGGIGAYPQDGFIHVDVRPKRTRWSRIDGVYLWGIEAGVLWKKT